MLTTDELTSLSAWASIISLLISFITLIVTSKVNAKINKIYKNQNDEKYFNKKVDVILKGLNEYASLINDNSEQIFNTREYAKLYSAETFILSSWGILHKCDGRVNKKIKKNALIKKFNKVFYLLDKKEKSYSILTKYVNEIITEIEKEKEYDK
ncbi:hypothetical protein [[Clostridium] fimetarium]|nr:hypothetical protein [[Clostridium] fimetarium]